MERARAIFERLRPHLPAVFAWLSLVTGLLSAWWMDRSPQRAPEVAIASVASWVAMFVYIAFLHAQRQQPERRARWRTTGHAVALYATQSASQSVLFFATPFYVRASCWLGLQTLFVATLAVAAAATLWDPWHRFILAHPVFGAAFQGIATFAGLNVVLPILGLSNAWSLYVSYAFAAAAAPSMVLWALPHRRPQHALGALACTAMGAIVLMLPQVRAAIPPAPLRMVHAAMGSHMLDLDLADATAHFDVPPEQLVCFTEVWAPRGINDEIVHLWYKDGVLIDTIELALRGGAHIGFRTWSTKQNLSSRPDATWRCRVQTATGQVLGETSVTIGH